MYLYFETNREPVNTFLRLYKVWSTPTSFPKLHRWWKRKLKNACSILTRIALNYSSRCRIPEFTDKRLHQNAKYNKSKQKNDPRGALSTGGNIPVVYATHYGGMQCTSDYNSRSCEIEIPGQKFIVTPGIVVFRSLRPYLLRT